MKKMITYFSFKIIFGCSQANNDASNIPEFSLDHNYYRILKTNHFSKLLFLKSIYLDIVNIVLLLILAIIKVLTTPPRV